MAFRKLRAETLRKHKGLSFPGITTVFWCYDGAGRILLAKRGKSARDEQGRWEPGAGGLKHGYSVEDNIRRELKEEYGAEPIDMTFIGYLDVFRENDEGRNSHWLAMYYAVKVDPATVSIQLPDEVEEIGWFTLDNLPTPTHSQMKVFMRTHGDTLRTLIAASRE